MDRDQNIQLLKKAVEESILDEQLIKSEKKEIKALLNELKPDKQLADVLRAQLYDLAQARINETNYPAIIKWIEDLNKLILGTQKSERIKESVYFSPGEDCLNAILSQIRSASQLIQICLFTISDDRISEELISKHKRGTHVKIITDNDKIYDKGSDIDRLFSAGIPVKVDMTDNHMHHKFALFDKKTTITGSYNWTRSAERYNHENIIISDSPMMRKAFEKEYRRLWDELIFYDQI